MSSAWAIFRLKDHESGGVDWDCIGVCTTKERALEMCKDNKTAGAHFELDKDYTEETRFFVVSKANPEGIWVGDPIGALN